MAEKGQEKKKIVKYWRKSKVVAISTDLSALFLQLCMNKDPLLLLYKFIVCYNYWTKAKVFLRKHAPHSQNCISFTPSTCFSAPLGITTAYSHPLWWFPAWELHQMCPGWVRRVLLPSQGTEGAAAPLPLAAELSEQRKPGHSLLLPTAPARLSPAAEHETKCSYFKREICYSPYTHGT